MADDLEERLRSHADAFDGLLSLIPAKYYYGEDNSDQWQRKKQTKEQARNAKRAKLDPDSQKTAKDVMDEQARKRKRDGDEENDGNNSDGSASDSDSVFREGHELPREGLNRGQKKQKRDEEDKTESDKQLDQKRNERAERKAAKKEARKKKLAEKLEKKKLAEQQKKAKEAKTQPEKQPKKDVKKDAKAPAPAAEKEVEKDTEMKDVDMEDAGDEEIEKIEGFSINEETDATPATEKPTTETKPQETQSQPPKPKQSQEELKQRLQKRLEELRAARHADGLNGKPARNRQELIEARRQREEARRAHKKELRQKAKEEEQRKNDEAISRRFSPRGGSLLASPGSPADSITSISNNFSFGRVMFADGQQAADPTLTSLREEKKKRGPQDAKTALLAAEAKKQRLAAMDPEKRKEIEEKDRWLAAKKRAHGEKVKDDVSLLKKTVHRHESLKKKSEKEWKERMEGIAKGKEMKQKKREENLKKRKEEKGNKGKKKAGKGRAGFEGKGGKR
ncbi:Surfeit locus 6 [Ascosphaera apis ARSEF 7405]|uniref:Surfeit locus 6 n=1 Tax=Ascosphaera apis ARSEF 7405 TaxID=392613 RepID=A0A168CRY6_9EURO|nr:Surfeit locus 6 [Ascosphaera apis ARSEF 7405]